MTKRGEIVEAIGSALNGMTTSGYSWDKITYWQDTSTQEDKNHLDYRDTTEEEIEQNGFKGAILNLEISGVVGSSNTLSAASLGTIAIADIRQTVLNLRVLGKIPSIKRSHKYVETKGKTVCLVEVEVEVQYKI